MKWFTSLSKDKKILSIGGCVLFILLSILVLHTIGGAKTDKTPELIQSDIMEEPGENESAAQSVIETETASPAEVEIASESPIIKVYDKGSVRQMPIDDYVIGVVSQEMPLTFDKEALKAQAVAARTYTLNKIQNGGCGRGGADICSDHTHCQAFTNDIPSQYQKVVYEAVYETAGEALVYENNLIDALYHSSSGGRTEDSANVFGDRVYLKSVDSPNEESYSAYEKQVSFSIEEAKTKVRQSKGDLTDDTITILEWFESGRVKTANVFGHYMSGKEIRTVFGLASANFEVTETENGFLFETTGYGHGVGMSQTGADAMARQGKTYDEILSHYYSDIQLNKFYK